MGEQDPWHPPGAQRDLAQASSSSTSRMPVEKQKRTDEAADSEGETKRRTREEEKRASTKRELEGEASAPPASRRKSDLALNKTLRELQLTQD